MKTIILIFALILILAAGALAQSAVVRSNDSRMTDARKPSSELLLAAYEVGAPDAAAALTTTNLTNNGFRVNGADAKTLTRAYCLSDAGDQTVTVKITPPGAGSTVTLFAIHCVDRATYASGTTDGSAGHMIAASMTNTAIAAHYMFDLSGTANTTTKDVRIFIYGTVN